MGERRNARPGSRFADQHDRGGKAAMRCDPSNSISNPDLIEHTQLRMFAHFLSGTKRCQESFESVIAYMQHLRAYINSPHSISLPSAPMTCTCIRHWRAVWIRSISYPPHVNQWLGCSSIQCGARVWVPPRISPTLSPFFPHIQGQVLS
jgi:hypothetical protein